MTGRGALVGLALLASACAAQDQPDRPVVDAAEILSPQTEKSLGQRIERFSRERKTAIVVATLPSLEGETIEAAARRRFNNWGIGTAGENRGVLVLIAPAEKQTRIEVGCGLETVVTAAAAQQIIDMAMVPQFRAGRFDSGASAAVEGLIRRIDTANVPAGPVSPACVQIMKEAA